MLLQSSLMGVVLREVEDALQWYRGVVAYSEPQQRWALAGFPRLPLFSFSMHPWHCPFSVLHCCCFFFSFLSLCFLLKLFMVHIPIYKFHKNTLEEFPVSSHSQISQKDTWGFVQFASHSQISHKTCWNFPVSRAWFKSIISPSTTTQKRTAIFPSLYLNFSMEFFFMIWVLSASELFFVGSPEICFLRASISLIIIC